MVGDDQRMFAGLEAKGQDDVCFDLVVVDCFESA